MNAADKLRLLNQQIAEAKGGKPDNFSTWRERSEVVLRAAVGDGSPLAQRFGDVSYGLNIYSSDTPQSAFDRARESGVRRAISILDAAKLEVEIGASEDDASSPGLPVVLNPPELREVEVLVKDLRSQFDDQSLSLDPESAAEFDTDLKAVEDQLRSPKPKRAIVKSAFQSLALILGALALSMAGNAAYAGLTDLLKRI